MKTLSIMVLTGFLFGCATPPQTVNDFRADFKGGPKSTKVEKHEVNRPFANVYDDIKSHSDKCLNVVVTAATSGSSGLQRSAIRYRSTTRKTGDQAGEMVLQLAKEAPEKMPEGGYFTLLTDIGSISADRTRITIYGPSVMYDDAFDAIFSWARGKDRICPSLP